MIFEEEELERKDPGAVYAKEVLKVYDRNQNGVLDLSEARLYINDLMRKSLNDNELRLTDA